MLYGKTEAFEKHNLFLKCGSLQLKCGSCSAKHSQGRCSDSNANAAAGRAGFTRLWQHRSCTWALPTDLAFQGGRFLFKTLKEQFSPIYQGWGVGKYITDCETVRHCNGEDHERPWHGLGVLLAWEHVLKKWQTKVIESSVLCPDATRDNVLGVKSLKSPVSHIKFFTIS